MVQGLDGEKALLVTATLIEGTMDDQGFDPVGGGEAESAVEEFDKLGLGVVRGAIEVLGQQSEGRAVLKSDMSKNRLQSVQDILVGSVQVIEDTEGKRRGIGRVDGLQKLKEFRGRFIAASHGVDGR